MHPAEAGKARFEARSCCCLAAAAAAVAGQRRSKRVLLRAGCRCEAGRRWRRSWHARQQQMQTALPRRPAKLFCCAESSQASPSRRRCSRTMSQSTRINVVVLAQLRSNSLSPSCALLQPQRSTRSFCAAIMTTMRRCSIDLLLRCRRFADDARWTVHWGALDPRSIVPSRGKN